MNNRSFGVLEGTGFDVLDPRFSECLWHAGRVHRLWTGGRWLEGPAWFAAHRSLVWSDIPNNRILRLDERSGAVTTFREPSNNSNGNTVDPDGRLLTCEHLTRRVVRTEHNGGQTILASDWNGKRLNSPNDVVVRSDGSVWFTDPCYGILSSHEGDVVTSEIGACNLYRIDPLSGRVACLADDFVQPNGLAFSCDESTLYVADTGGSHQPGGPRHIRALRLSSDGLRVESSRIFAECSQGFFDGFRVDERDRIWASAADGVHAYLPDGTLLGKVLIPEVVANVCFGGIKRNRLFICGTSSLYCVDLDTTGLSGR